VIGSRRPRVTEPTSMSLAQFTRTLALSEFQGGPPSVAEATVDIGAEGIGQKNFAADVVGAMSNPALEPNEEVAELPERQNATAKSKGGP
jgi:hypothetical protein